MKKKILITGLSGAVGQAIKPSLEKKYNVHSLSRNGTKNLDSKKNHIGDIRYINSISKAFNNIHTVIHLAADGGVNSPEGMKAEWNSILGSNIVGTYNVFEASVKNGIKRIIYASSGSTIMGYENEHPYSNLIEGKMHVHRAQINHKSFENKPNLNPNRPRIHPK